MERYSKVQRKTNTNLFCTPQINRILCSTYVSFSSRASYLRNKQEMIEATEEARRSGEGLIIPRDRYQSEKNKKVLDEFDED